MHLNTSCPQHPNQTTSRIGIPWESHNPKYQFHYLPKKSTISSNNPWTSLAFHNLYRPFYYISHDLRSLMTCLSDSAQYQGNLHGHHTRRYTMLYSGSCGNCHHKQTSPTTGDEPSYHLKSIKVITQACPLGSE